MPKSGGGVSRLIFVGGHSTVSPQSEAIFAANNSRGLVRREATTASAYLKDGLSYFVNGRFQAFPSGPVSTREEKIIFLNAKDVHQAPTTD